MMMLTMMSMMVYDHQTCQHMFKYPLISNISHTEFEDLNVSRRVLQFTLPNKLTHRATHSTTLGEYNAHLVIFACKMSISLI